MKIYETPTLKIENLNRIKEIIRNLKNKKVNLFLTQQCLGLYGPHILNDIEKIIEKNVNVIPEVGKNLGLFLSLINLNVKYISINSNLDPIFKKKIVSIAKKKNINLLQNEQFKFINNQNNL